MNTTMITLRGVALALLASLILWAVSGGPFLWLIIHLVTR